METITVYIKNGTLVIVGGDTEVCSLCLTKDCKNCKVIPCG